MARHRFVHGQRAGRRHGALAAGLGQGAQVGPGTGADQLGPGSWQLAAGMPNFLNRWGTENPQTFWFHDLFFCKVREVIQFLEVVRNLIWSCRNSLLVDGHGSYLPMFPDFFGAVWPVRQVRSSDAHKAAWVASDSSSCGANGETLQWSAVYLNWIVQDTKNGHFQISKHASILWPPPRIHHNQSVGLNMMQPCGPLERNVTNIKHHVVQVKGMIPSCPCTRQRHAIDSQGSCVDGSRFRNADWALIKPMDVFLIHTRPFGCGKQLPNLAIAQMLSNCWLMPI